MAVHVLAIALGTGSMAEAAAHYGQVTLAGVPVPGATITASQGDSHRITTSDEQGMYRLVDLSEGVWTIRVDMLGFAPVSRSIDVTVAAPPSMWELTLLGFDEIAALVKAGSSQDPTAAGRERQPIDRTDSQAATPVGSLAPQSGAADRSAQGSDSETQAADFQRADVNPVREFPAAGSTEASPLGNEAPADLGLGAADGFLINGSVNNSAASPFAQAAAFGNNRPGLRSLYNGGIAALVGHSAWDARPFSFTGQQTPGPDYTDVQVVSTFGGPIRIPPLRNRAIVFAGYQRASDHSTSTQSAIMPTPAERAGDFSQSRDAFGRPVRVVDPATGLPFAGNVIPRERISPQASSLLGYYPAPNLALTDRFNYQRPVLVATVQDSVQSRVTQVVDGRNQVFGTFAYQRTTTDAATVFGFVDETRASSLDINVTWSRRFSQFFSLRLRYQFTRTADDVTPHFAKRTNLSGEAGITGNDQDPLNWGPPTIMFSSGIAGLSSAQYASNTNLTHGATAEGVRSAGRHTVTFGGGGRPQRFDVFAQQDGRGGFTFTGSATGSDLADFLLGIPHASTIAFGNPDKHLRASAAHVYIQDDWRPMPALTVNAGVRWEYESPLTERFGRLVNLDITPDFSAVRPVVSTDSLGAPTGQQYPEALMRGDRGGIQPRLGVAWRPVPGSSLVVRGTYGVYRNTAIYQPIAMLMAQQPPFSKTLSVENSPATPLTLANGFVARPGTATNTFAVDPDFRVGFAQNWQVSAQRDLPASLTLTLTYLGAKGSRLMQEFLPNTYPSGAANPCPNCPTGFVYLTSDGSSSRQAGQIQLRRRLRNGLAASVQYTLSKAVDNAAAFSGAGTSGLVIAQDWRDLDAERGPSSFDQRHLVSAQVQYTTGAGIAGGTLLDGVRGTLFKDWTIISQLATGSGLPQTPIYLTSVRGTGVTGTIRAAYTGARLDAIPPGFYLNPAAFTAPSPGQWGTAGRNSVTGPAPFALSAAVTRTFRWGDRLNVDWRIDASNVLNRVTYASVNMIVGSPQFGLPNRANPMRRVQTSLRLRF